MPTQPLDVETTDGLLKAMLVFSRTVERVLQERASEAARDSISRSKLQILRLLDRRGAQSAAQIARFLSVSKPAITQTVASMLEDELLEREISKEDRRRFELSLTSKGRQALREVIGKQRHFVRNAVRDLETKDVASWTSVLDQMARALVQADRRFQGYCLQCGAHANDTCVLSGGPATCLFLEMSADRTTRRR